MEQKKEAVYLINDERYLHLRENGAGVGFATYNKVTGEPLESGQISEKNLPPDGRNAIPAARNWYLFELSDDDRKIIQQESVKILENIPQAGIGRRRIWEPETLPKDIRLINSHYDDLYRIPDGGVIQVDYPDCDTDVVFTDVETGEKYKIGYITQGVTERIKLERGKWYKVVGRGNLTLNPVNIRVE